MLHPEPETETRTTFAQQWRNYAVPQTWRLASLSRRFGALIIDSLILGVINKIISTILHVGLMFSTLDSLTSSPILLFLLQWGIPLFTLALAYAYYVYFYASSGQTPGKKLLSIEVMRADQRPLGLGSSLRRSLACLLVPSLMMTYTITRFVGLDNLGLVSWGYWLMVGIALLLVIDHLWALWDADRQTLHDKLAGTVVVRA